MSKLNEIEVKAIKNLVNSKWQLSFVSGCCIGIEIDMGGGMSRILLNTILPDTDKQYKKEKPEIEGLMKYICDLHNQESKAKALAEALEKIKGFTNNAATRIMINKALENYYKG